MNTSDIFKQREFSELISDTINFFIREAKSLIKFIFKYTLVFILAKSLIAHYYNSFFYFEYAYYTNFFDLIRFGPIEQIGLMFSLKFIDFIIYSMLFVIVGAYVKVYAAKGIVEKKEIGLVVKSMFLKVLGSNVLIIILLIISLFILIFPAIYLSVIFSIVPVIIIFEDIGVGKAITKSLLVFKGNWWKSLGAFLVIFIIYLIFTLIVSLIFPRLFMLFRFVPFVFVISSLVTGFLYTIAAAFPVLLAVILYTSYYVRDEKSINPEQKPSVKRRNENPDIKENRMETKKAAPKYKDKEWQKLQDKDEQKNRFLNDNETDRFKPKY